MIYDTGPVVYFVMIWPHNPHTPKFASFSMGFNGLCYSIVPNNVMLKPGTNYYFFIESSIVDKKDQIKGIDLMFSTENTYFATSKCQ